MCFIRMSFEDLLSKNGNNGSCGFSESNNGNTILKPIRKQLVIGKHIQINKDGPHKFTCTICNSSFSRKQQVRYHDYCLSGKRPLKCDLCGKRFIKKTHLLYHVRTHTGESPFTCETCQKSFKQKAKLKRHERTHNSNAESRLICSRCNKSFSDKDSLRKHEQKHSGRTFTCNNCKKSYSNKFTLKQHMETHRTPSFVCDICGKSFLRKNSLNVHKQVHEDSYSFGCRECYKMFRSKKELTQHSIVHDENNPRHVCHICKVSCGRRDNLLRHIRNCHFDPSQEKKYEKEVNSSKEVVEKADNNENDQPSLPKALSDQNNKETGSHEEEIEKRRKKMKPPKNMKYKVITSQKGSSKFVVKLLPTKIKRKSIKKIDPKEEGPGKLKSLLKDECDTNKTSLPKSIDSVQQTLYSESLKSKQPEKNISRFVMLSSSFTIKSALSNGKITRAVKTQESISLALTPKNSANTCVKSASATRHVTNPSFVENKPQLDIEEPSILNKLLDLKTPVKKYPTDSLFPQLFENVSQQNSLFEPKSEPALQIQGGSNSNPTLAKPVCNNPSKNTNNVNEIEDVNNSIAQINVPPQKTSVIVHTDVLKALVLEANSYREPVIKFSGPPCPLDKINP